MRGKVYKAIQKNFKLAKKQNKELDKLFEVVNILANGGTLDARMPAGRLDAIFQSTQESQMLIRLPAVRGLSFPAKTIGKILQ